MQSVTALYLEHSFRTSCVIWRFCSNWISCRTTSSSLSLSGLNNIRIIPIIIAVPIRYFIPFILAPIIEVCFYRTILPIGWRGATGEFGHYPSGDLAEIAAIWPQLPEDVKAAIRVLAQSSCNTEKRLNLQKKTGIFLTFVSKPDISELIGRKGDDVAGRPRRPHIKNFQKSTFIVL